MAKAPSKIPVGFRADADGQLEIENIDTPIGIAAEALLKADAKFHTAREGKNEAEATLIEEMKKVNVRTFKFKGDTLRYTPGHTTPDKISFRKTEG